MAPAQKIPSQEEEPTTIIVDGQSYTVEELSFREQRELRRIARELVDDPEANLEDLAVMDVFPAFAYIIIHRDNPDFTIDDALDLKMSDMLPEEKPPKRPTKRRATT